MLRAGARHGPDRGYYYQLLAGFGWSTLPVLGLIRQPTLIVAGDDDPIIPAINAKIMQRGIPDARTHLYRGGHLALLTEAAELAPVIDGFLAAAPGVRPRPQAAVRSSSSRTRATASR